MIPGVSKLSQPGSAETFLTTTLSGMLRAISGRFCVTFGQSLVKAVSLQTQSKVTHLFAALGSDS